MTCKRIKIPGPPGTGKTYRLVNHYLRKELEEYKTDHKQILYVGFSNATVNEAKTRIDKVFPGNEVQVKTLHSFGKNHLGNLLEHDGLLKGKKWNEFMVKYKWFDINFDSEPDEDTGYIKYQDWRMKIIEYAKCKLMTIHELGHAAYELGLQHNINNIEELEQLYQDIEDYKRDYHTHEFSDMIKKFVDNECTPSLKSLFVDEAQDLNPLEWSMIKHLEELDSVERSYIAGDDDQAIYAFKGGVASKFINMPGELDPQINSNRVPRSVHREALKILKNIKNRLPKEWKPRDEEGEVYWGHTLPDINFNKEEWLILTRKNDYHYPILDYLESDSQYIEHPKAKLLPPLVLRGWRTWDLLKKGEPVEVSEIKHLYKNFFFVKKGHLQKKDKLDKYSYTDTKRFEGHEWLSLKELRLNHGLLFDGEGVDLEMLDDQRLHIKKLLEKGEDLHAKPRIKVSTIHKMKGGEAENVILFTDMTKFIYDQASRTSENRDTEHRIWFVAVTRAKKRLYYMALDPISRFNYVPGKDII